MVKPSAEWVEKQKKVYGKLFSVSITGDTYVYRPLTRGEHIAMTKKLSEEGEAPKELGPQEMIEMENEVAKLCVIWPENLDLTKVSAGVPSTLATFVSKVSGYEIDGAPEEL